ncbi:MAG: LysM peptidoglycan-binding domain-containing protein [Acidimicrobiia bacterium]|nr:LysM peptidoglycan-binding domain-containing protein [Acidimicrobiia bacterium]
MRTSTIRRNIFIGFCSLTFGVLASCTLAPTRARFINSFVPPSPAPQQQAPLPEPPEIDDGLLDSHEPVMLAQAALPRPSVEADIRIARAKDHFQRGADLSAKPDAARVEFDKALETLLSAPVNTPGRAKLITEYQKLVEATYRIEVDAANQSAPDQEPAFDKAPLESILEMTFPLEPGLEGKVREQLQATVSQLPLELADPVLSYINYFSGTRGRRTLVSGFQRAGRYAPMIRRILDEEGVPQEMIYLAQAESGFLPRAVSRKKATGMWQFVQFRGREYGLMQNAHTDDRLDPEKATRAAARHLRDLYTQFGDWYLAVAAYNCGPVNVERAVQRTGYADFWQLYKRNVLPRETSNYLPIIIAMTIMAKNPADYDLTGVAPDPPLEYDDITVPSITHLALIADLSGKPLAAIRELNPAVLKLVAPPGFTVHVPKGAAHSVLAGLDAIPSERRASWRVHKVGPSDTLTSIARKYNTTEKSLLVANGSAPLQPEAGDLLVVPVSYPGPAVVVRKAAAKKTPVRRKTASSSKKSTSKTASSKKPAPAKPSSKPSPANAVASGPRSAPSQIVRHN